MNDDSPEQLDSLIEELDKAYEEFKWAYVQLKYERYLSTFSPAYLSGCDWYQILGDDFRKGYYNYKLNSVLRTIDNPAA